MNTNNQLPPQTVKELESVLVTQGIDFGPLPERDPDTGKRVSVARREIGDCLHDNVRVAFYLGTPDEQLSLADWLRVCDELKIA